MGSTAAQEKVSMLKRLALRGRNTLSLGPRRWALLVEALAELFLARRKVTGSPPTTYLGLLTGEPDPGKHRLSMDAVRELVWAVESVGRFTPESINCLPRALALQRMLLRRGEQGTIRFGVKRGETGVLAHAWLVHADKVVMGQLPDLDSFTPLSAWPDWCEPSRRSEGARGRED